MYIYTSDPEAAEAALRAVLKNGGESAALRMAEAIREEEVGSARSARAARIFTPPPRWVEIPLEEGEKKEVNN